MGWLIPTSVSLAKVRFGIPGILENSLRLCLCVSVSLCVCVCVSVCLCLCVFYVSFVSLRIWWGWWKQLDFETPFPPAGLRLAKASRRLASRSKSKVPEAKKTKDQQLSGCSLSHGPNWSESLKGSFTLATCISTNPAF